MSPDRDDADALIEVTLTAHREWGPDQLPIAPPAWWDLSPEDRERAFRLQLESRRVESLLDDRGWSATMHAVMLRIAR